MSAPITDVKNWMQMFRWVVKLIRDEYSIEETLLVRSAVLEADLGLTIEQVERVLDLTAEAFGLRFPPDTLDEVIRLEELCLVASWLKGFYKRPSFIGVEFEAGCRSINSDIPIEA